MKKVACLLADGFEETEAIQTVDILRRAHIHVDLVSIKDKVVTGSHHIQIHADLIMGDSLDDYDMILLPGGQPGTDNLIEEKNEICEDFKNDSRKVKIFF